MRCPCLTARLRQAEPMMCDCKQKRDLGLASSRHVGRYKSHDSHCKPCCPGGGGGGGGNASGACGRPSLSYVMRRRSSITRSASSSGYAARSRTDGDETPRKSMSSPCEMPPRSPDSKY